jgi:hypothetical protein
MAAMPVTRSVLLVIFCAAQAGHAVLASPILSETPFDVSPIIEVQARKGTRLYSPDGTGAAPTLPADTATEAQSAAEALEQCMTTWDTGTHITKSKWREICQRQLKDRENMYR